MSTSRSRSDRPRAGVASMTGYGTAVGESRRVRIEVEIRTTNGRYLDIQPRLPRLYGDFEGALRDQVAASIRRGRVDISTTRTPLKESPLTMRLNRPALLSLSKLYRGVGKDLGVRSEVIEEAILRDGLARKEILWISELPTDVKSERSLFLRTVERALASLTAMREREGVKLARDIRVRCSILHKIREAIASQAVTRPAAIRKKLLAGVRAISSEVALSEERLATELAILIERLDVTEELVRLKSHLDQFSKALSTPHSGKKLDFIVQEMVREFNTIGSKAQDSAVQHLVVEAKTEVERIREQVQNLE